MSSTPRTSFVIPARNAAATLAQTLNSVLAQSDRDWEALIVDDTSSDTTPALIADYVQRDARFYALRGRGAGVAAARNVALQQAHGRCVVFLDSDDWIAPSHLERLHAALDAAPGATAAYCDRHRVMPDGALAPAHGEPQIAHTPFEMFARTCAVAIHAVLVVREAVTRAGGFDPSLRTCEDWDLWQRIVRQGGRWVHVAEPLAFYRTSDNSLSQDMHRVLADAAVVIQRGFSADPRVLDADVAHAGGASCADGATPERALAYFTLWCCAVDAVRGRENPQLRIGLEALPATSDHAKHIAIALVDAVMVGLLCVPRQLAARWPEHGPRITALIEALGTIWQDAAAARRLQYAFERLLLQHDDLAALRPLSLTLGLRVDLRMLTPVTPPPGVDRFYVYLCNGDNVLAVAEAGALGTFAPRDWIELAARHLGWDRVMVLAHRQLMRSITVRGLTDAARAVGRATQRPAARGQGWRPRLELAVHNALLALAAPSTSAGGHSAELRRLRETSPQESADLLSLAHESPLPTALYHHELASHSILSGAAARRPAPADGVSVTGHLVSVVIPAYNAEATLDETLRSVRAQTHQALDIVVVDDGSTDGTRALGEQHAAADARVQVLHRANAGVAAARNAGWQHARSEFIAFIDADDLWAPTKIEKQLAALLLGGDRIGLVYCWFARIDHASRIVGLHDGPLWQGDVTEPILMTNFIGNGSSALMRREALVAAGGFEPGLQAQGAHGCEDYLLYFRVAVAYHFALVPERLVGYRHLPNNMSSNRPRMLRSWMLVHDEMIALRPERAGAAMQGVRNYADWLVNDALSRGALGQLASLLWLLAVRHPGAAIRVVVNRLLRPLAGRLLRRRRVADSVTSIQDAPAAGLIGRPFSGDTVGRAPR